MPKKKEVTSDDLLERLEDEDVASLVVTRLEEHLKPIVKRIFDNLAKDFTSKLEALVLRVK